MSDSATNVELKAITDRHPNSIALAAWMDGRQVHYEASTHFPSLEYPAALLLLTAIDQYRAELVTQFAAAFKVTPDALQLHMIRLRSQRPGSADSGL